MTAVRETMKETMSEKMSDGRGEDFQSGEWVSGLVTISAFRVS